MRGTIRSDGAMALAGTPNSPFRQRVVKPIKIRHFADCTKASREYAKILKLWEKRYPKYCRACRGWGYLTYREDPSPRGVSLSAGYMEFSDPCPECVEKGICPRCGNKTLYEEVGGGNLFCVGPSGCGWTDVGQCGQSGKEFRVVGLPEEPECWCEMRRDHKDVP